MNVQRPTVVGNTFWTSAMTNDLDVVWKVAGPSTAYHWERSANGGWPLCGLRRWKSACSGWRPCQRSDETTLLNQPRQPLKISLIPCAAVVKTVNVIIKADVISVRLNRSPSKDWSRRCEWPSFTQQSWRSTNQTWPFAEAAFIIGFNVRPTPPTSTSWSRRRRVSGPHLFNHSPVIEENGKIP